MTDMESLDRAVEEARQELFDVIDESILDYANLSAMELVEAFEAAVSAKARAEERERIYEEQRAQSKTWPIEGANVAAGAPREGDWTSRKTLSEERQAEHDPEMDEWMDAPMGPTYEWLCATCSHASHGGLPCSAYTSGLRSCPCSGESQAAPSVPPPSDALRREYERDIAEIRQGVREASPESLRRVVGAAPSTDEGEARPYVGINHGTQNMWIVPPPPGKDVPGTWHEEWWDMNLALQAEVERLREALMSAASELGVPNAGYPAPVSNAAEIIRAALATPPSSTEGTKEVEG